MITQHNCAKQQNKTTNPLTKEPATKVTRIYFQKQIQMYKFVDIENLIIILNYEFSEKIAFSQIFTEYR